jgi:hypothetical protein
MGFSAAGWMAALLLPTWARGYMSPMCCGDNFCCAVKTDATVDCWGGNSFTTVVASDGSVDSERDLSDVKYVACAGKSLVAVGSDDTLIAVMGKTGYGADSFDASDLGTKVRSGTHPQGCVARRARETRVVGARNGSPNETHPETKKNDAGSALPCGVWLGVVRKRSAVCCCT